METSMKLKRVAVIFNPKGGTARSTRLKALVSALESRKLKVSTFATSADPNSARDLAADAANSGFWRVVAMGGDGTVGGVVEGLIGRSVVGSVYAGGTGNIFAKTFLPPLTPDSFADMLVSGNPQEIDVLSWSCTDESKGPQSGIAIVAVGFGKLLDAIGEADPKLKKRFGKAVYAHNMALAATSPEPVFTLLRRGMELREDHLSAALLMNVPPPDAPSLSIGCNASDGLLDFVGVNGSNLAQLISTTVKIGIGRAHTSSHYWRWRAKELVVQTERPVLINIDGDPGPITKQITVAVRHKAVALILAP
jgi:diacylglycerol kinase (ATP)